MSRSRLSLGCKNRAICNFKFLKSVSLVLFYYIIFVNIFWIFYPRNRRLASLLISSVLSSMSFISLDSLRMSLSSEMKIESCKPRVWIIWMAFSFLDRGGGHQVTTILSFHRPVGSNTRPLYLDTFFFGYLNLEEFVIILPTVVTSIAYL